MDKNKETKFDFNTDWYEIWMKQSKDFFETANTNLKDTFQKPEDNLKQINDWVAELKKQWEFTQLTDEQKAYQAYWNAMIKMCNEASDLMVKQWLKRSEDKNPITTVRELYDLWLNCCHEVYQQSIKTKSYQETYADLMNAAFKFWKSMMPK